MKLRKNQTILPKNFFVPPREMKNIHGRNPQIAPEKSKSSRIKAIRVTICRDARSCVRCIKCYSVGLLSVSVGSTTDAQTVRPYKSLHVELLHVGLLLHHGFNGDGRTTVRPYKSLHVELLHVGLLLYHGFNGDGRTTVRPYKLLHVRSLHVNCYCVVVLTGTDARPCVPTNRYTSHRYTSGCYTSDHHLMWCGI